MSLDQLTADQLIQYLSWAFYLLIFVYTTIRAVRRPLRANIDIALFFTCSTIIIFIAILQRLGILATSDWLTVFTTSLLIGLAFFLMRLTDDFWVIPGWLVRTSEIGVALIIAGNIFFAIVPAPGSIQYGLFGAFELLYLVFFFGYSSLAFVRASRLTTGVTYRRMRAVAFGSGFLVAAFLISYLGRLLISGLDTLWSVTYDLLGLASGISYYLGFAPPVVLRRAWQEPELRTFLSRAASLPRLPDTHSIVREMEQGAANSVGAPRASIGLWDEEKGVLRYTMEDGVELDIVPAPDRTSSKAFLTQRSLFSDNLQRDHPDMRDQSERYGAVAMLVAPITAGKKRLGVLAVYAPRAPIFADDDLNLVQLLADQAAVVLESRALIDEAARVQAREEVTRLKEDFLSAAAHDLKTPLTTLVAQAQLLERRVQRAPDQPVEPESIHKLVREAQRLRDLVLELLDASRTEQGKLVSDLEPVDLGEVAHEICERYTTTRHPCTVEVEGQARGMYDRTRMLQLMENLVENAVKYSPAGGPVSIKVWNGGDRNYFTVSDRGIGIPASDLPDLFERFHRGTNVDDRRFAGMGLGLYICRGIVEQHGGQISVHSAPGQGTTFEVSLPVEADAAIAEPSAIGGKIAS